VVLGVGGLPADRIGRPRLTIAAMMASGAIAVMAGLVDGLGLWPITIVCLLWGFTICADSEQCSAAIAEFTDPGAGRHDAQHAGLRRHYLDAGDDPRRAARRRGVGPAGRLLPARTWADRRRRSDDRTVCATRGVAACRRAAMSAQPSSG